MTQLASEDHNELWLVWSRAEPHPRRARGETLDRVYGLFPILKTRRRQLAGSLSGGQQQMLAIGRALMVAGGAPAVLREQTRIQEAYLGLRDGGRPS